jgi:hypothetical protein
MCIVVAGALAVAMAASGVGAHDDGTTSHLWLDHIKPMRVAGTINDPANPVDWTKLKNVPAEIADGNDAGVEAAGFGLGKGRGPYFYVKSDVIQRRVDSFCATGQSIKSVAVDGSVTCTAGPRGFIKRVADTGLMCNVACTEGYLVLSPGTWAINAKIGAYQTVAGNDYMYVVCTLDAGGLSDYSVVDVEMSGLGAPIATLPMQLIATLSSNLHASVNCGDSDEGEVQGHDLSIMAVRLSD